VARVGHRERLDVRARLQGRDRQPLASDCATTLIRICRESLAVGDLTVGGTGGTVVCGTDCVVPVRESTWSAIKATYLTAPARTSSQ
jgi:hypothetical protein